VPDRLGTPEISPHVSWPKFYDGYADAMITEDGYIGMVWVSGNYPVSIPASFFIGKYLDDLHKFVEGIPLVKESIISTIATGRRVTVHGTVNGQVRIGMTIPVNYQYAVLRIFAPRS